MLITVEMTNQLINEGNCNFKLEAGDDLGVSVVNL